jgi:uncharacterized membrane protein
MEALLTLTHVVFGVSVLLLGLSISLSKKGTNAHKKMGLFYVISMWIVCFSAFAMIAFIRFSIFLLVIGVLTFYSSYVGYRVLKRKEIGSETWYDWLFASLAFLFGVGLIGYGVSLFFKVQEFSILGMLSIIFGYLTFSGGKEDLMLFLKKKTPPKHWWLRQHISAMGGSYIAAITEFGVQNVNKLPIDQSYSWLIWILPAILLSPVISIFKRKYA